ncbi:MAG: DUF151 domain-containing protein [Chitinophagales bacterium]|nr:DUF151 domain-containing protein [Chitinophagales bacterium]MDW8393607.1 DUF151 domain-containing protein [Chitinophagales bacterium]
MRKVELQILSITHSVSQAHSYAVLLGEVGGLRRLPIVIGGFEAQAIAVALENMKPTRPLTHDLMKNLCQTFNIEVKEVIINNLLDGIFYSQLICKYRNQIVEVDSRTSDALALAVRFDCPIYTFEFVLDSAGIIMEDLEQEEPEQESPKTESSSTVKEPWKISDLSRYSFEELNRMLQKLLEREDYEQAIMVRDEISRRKQKHS